MTRFAELLTHHVLPSGHQLFVDHLACKVLSRLDGSIILHKPACRERSRERIEAYGNVDGLLHDSTGRQMTTMPVQRVNLESRPSI